MEIQELKKKGRRPKPEGEKVEAVTFYTKKSTVEKWGGMEAARAAAKNHLEEKQ